MSDPMEGSSALPQKATQSTTILILGIVSVVCCGIAGPFAWVMGRNELESIQQGQIDSKNEGLARAGMILGIIGTVLLGIGLLWVVAALAFGFGMPFFFGNF